MSERLIRFLSRHLWLWFTLATLALFLGTRGLNEPDEGRYAEIAREMEESNDWLVPTLNGFEHFQKPPLLYWLTALSLRCFGHNEWAARLPSALAALGVVILTFGIARKLYSEKAAQYAAIMLVSGIEFFALARLLTPDMTMTFWIVAAIAAWVHERRWLFFIAMGLGFLTKGPMALVAPLSAAIAWQWPARHTPATRSLPWVRGLSLTLSIGLSWFITLSLWRHELFDYFWRYELVQRFGSHAHGRSQPWWFFIPILMLALMPWTFFLHQPARIAWRRWRTKSLEPRHALVLGWVCLPFLVLSCSGSKLLTYVLPLLPALAMAIAVTMSNVKLTWSIALPTTACWLLLASQGDRFAPLLQRQASVRSLAALLNQYPGSEQAPLFTCGVRSHGFEFYTDEVVSTTRGDADIVLPLDKANAARVFKNAQQCAKTLGAKVPAFGIVNPDQYNKIFQAKGWKVLGKEGEFLLITNDSMKSARLAK